MRLKLIFAALTALLPLIGCSSDYSPVAATADSVPASGTITWQGKPLAGFRITLHPAEGQRPAAGVSNAEGKFVLGTNSPNDGAVVGNHPVSVIWDQPVDDGLNSAPGDATLKPPINLPAKFSSPDTSGLKLDIPSGGSSTLQLDLK
jgi:hypothetical protein